MYGLWTRGAGTKSQYSRALVVRSLKRAQEEKDSRWVKVHAAPARYGPKVVVVLVGGRPR